MNDSIDFEKLGICIPNVVFLMPKENQQEIFDYLQQMEEVEKKAYIIAYYHLGSSFNIYRSNGFKMWKNNINNK